MRLPLVNLITEIKENLMTFSSKVLLGDFGDFTPNDSYIS